MTEIEMLEVANALVAPHGLRAEFLPGAQSVGVGGDQRTYTPVICLVGPKPDNDTLASLSTAISNQTGINRITIEIAVRR